jgi:hypothetical protein
MREEKAYLTILLYNFFVVTLYFFFKSMKNPEYLTPILYSFIYLQI